MLLLKKFKRFFPSKEKRFRFWRPKDKKFYDTYCEYQAKIENKILKAINIVLIIVNLAFVIITAIADKVDVPSVILFGVSTLTYPIKPYSIRVWKFFIVLSSFSFIDLFIQNSKAFSSVLYPGAFIMGNTIGIAECLVIFSLKNTMVKVLMLVTYTTFKVICFFDSFDLGTSLFFGVIVALSLLFCIYYDILEMRNFREFFKSKEQVERFKSLIDEDFPISILVMKPDLKSVFYVNRFFRDIFDYKESGSLDFFESIKVYEENMGVLDQDEETQLNLRECLQRFSSNPALLEEKEGNILLAKRIDRQDNKKFKYEIRIKAITWDMEDAYALIFHDTSDKQVVMAMKFMDEQKNRVINTLSHELKTPINGILGLVEAVKSRVEDKLSQTYLQYCEGCSKLLLNFINSVLDYNQLKQGSFKLNKSSSSLDGLLKEMKLLYLFHAQEKGLEFTVERDSDTPDIIYTDLNRLTMVLTTLLGNAFKFTVQGSVNLRVYCDAAFGGNLVFRVSDTGKGMEEDQETLFRMDGKYAKSNKNANAHGVGLGLAMANELVKVLNQDTQGLDFESVLHKGTSFYFKIKICQTLPLKESLMKSIRQKREEDMLESLKDIEIRELNTSGDLVAKKIESMNANQENYHFLTSQTPIESKEVSMPSSEEIQEKTEFPKNILVVDDNPFNILAVSFILEKFNCKITKSFNGQECITALEESISRHEKFDLILMDIQMPVLDGVEASRIIKNRIEEGTIYQVPVIALTANRVDQLERERYKQNGILECLEKPLKEQELRKSLNSLGFKQFSDSDV